MRKPIFDQMPLRQICSPAIVKDEKSTKNSAAAPPKFSGEGEPEWSILVHRRRYGCRA